MSFLRGTEEYYQKFIELQEKLRKSEEERLILEMKFNEMVQVTREEEQAYYRKLRNQYKRFLEEDRRRQERNERIMRILERIESRAAMLAAKTERFELLRQQYQAYLHRIYFNTRQQSKEPMPPEFSTISEEKPDLYDHPIVRTAVGGDKFENISQPSDLYNHPIVKRALSNNKGGYKPQNAKFDVVKQYLHSLSSPISGEEVLKTARSSNKISTAHSPEFIDSNGTESYKGECSYYKTDAGSIADQIITSINARPRLSSPYHDKYTESTYRNIKQKEQIPENSFCGIDSLVLTKSRKDDVDIFNDQGFLGESQHPNLENEMKFTPSNERNKKSEVKFQKLQDEKEDSMPEIPKISVEDGKYLNKNKEAKSIGDYKDLEEDHPHGEYRIPEANDIIASKESKIDDPAVCTEQFKEQIETNESLIHENIDETLKDNEDYSRDANEFDQELIYDNTNDIYEKNDEKIELNEAMEIDHYNEKDDTLHDENRSQIYNSEYNKVDEEKNQLIENTENIIEEDYSQNQQLDRKEDKIDFEEIYQPVQATDNFQPDYKLEDSNPDTTYDNQTNIDFKSESPVHKIQEMEPSYQDDKIIHLPEESDLETIKHIDKNQSAVPQNLQPSQLHERDNNLNTDAQNEQLKLEERSDFTKKREDDQPTVQNDRNDDQPITQYSENEKSNMQFDGGEAMMQYDQTGQPIIQYDETGQPIMQYDENGQPMMQYIQNGQSGIQYNQNGQPIMQYDENGQPIMQYDENGQPIIQYDDQGQPFMQYDDHRQELMQYDEHGQPLMQYDEHGQPLMQYDEDGQPIMQYDEHGQPILYNQAMNYDENGQPIYQYGQNEEYYPETQGYTEQQHFESSGVPEQVAKEEELRKPEIPTDFVKEPILTEKPPEKEKKPNVMEMLDTDTESVKQETKVSNDSDFDFSNN